MSGWRDIWAACTAPGVAKRALWTAVVVGTILNLINQGDAAAAGAALAYWKIALTYLVPYCVATYGAVSFQLSAKREAR